MRKRFWQFSVLFVLCMVSTAMAQPLAEKILDAAEFKGGLIVHLGCGDGKLTAALYAGDNSLVHGLDVKAENVTKARNYINSLDLYGPVSVDHFKGTELPYVDNLANLIVTEDLGDVPESESLRVLAPGGILYARRNGRWQKTVKPWPQDIDEWTHFLHDAGGNPVAHDDLVGPPRHIQWSAAPPYTRSHEHIPSMYALVSTGGRIFYIADEASVASIRQTPEWRLQMDAFMFRRKTAP